MEPGSGVKQSTNSRDGTAQVSDVHKKKKEKTRPPTHIDGKLPQVRVKLAGELRRTYVSVSFR